MARYITIATASYQPNVLDGPDPDARVRRAESYIEQVALSGGPRPAPGAGHG